MVTTLRFQTLSWDFKGPQVAMLCYAKRSPLPHGIEQFLLVDFRILVLVGGFKHEWIIFHFIYGMSSETH